MIYFDSAATSLYRPEGVAKAVSEAIMHMGNSGRGAHDVTLHASRVIYETRQKLARLFGIANPSRIAFTSNATEALNIAICGILKSGDHVITTACEHNSVLRPIYRMEAEGVEVSILPADRKGCINYDDFERNLKENTKAIVIHHASNLTGNVVDLTYVSRFAKEHQLLLIVDASQTAGILPIHVNRMGIDILCFTGHKGLMGPQGTGGIYVRDGIKVPSFKVGGSGVHSFSHEHPQDMPTALEAGTLNGHGIAGLHAALDFIRETGIEEIYQKEDALAKRFLKGVRQMPDVIVYGDVDAELRAPIVTLNIGDMDSAQVCEILAEDYEICVRGGAHCAPLMHEALGTAEWGAVRFSFSYFNTENEVDQAIEAIREIAADCF